MLDHRLETFLTLCRTMHYTRAAEALCITQPAVTQHIQFLEKRYGCRLFRYQGKSLHLTEEGKRLRRMALSLSYNSRRMEEAMQTPIPARIHAGATKSIGEFVIAPLISKFLRLHPEMGFSLEVNNTQALLHALDEGRLDFALIEGFFDKEKYGCRLLRQEAFFGICPPQHPFAGQAVPLSALLRETLIVREAGSGTRAIFESVLHEQNHTLHSFPRLIEISNFAVLKTLVAEGLGISFVYAPVAEREIAAGSLASFTLEHTDIRREFNFVYLHDNLFQALWQSCVGE